ncbi:MAG: exo-alpha-sialidase [Akkermansiaceae bacterium]|nr:exo-alpha-sialidase [Akkermansiaceae bacterium]
MKTRKQIKTTMSLAAAMGTLALATSAQAAVLTNTQTSLVFENNVYSPEIFEIAGRKRMLTGGWLTNSIAAAGRDQIYISDYNGGQWTTPTAIRWTNSGYVDGEIAGYQINDPTVVQVPNSSELYMYYTGNPAGNMDFTRHVVGFAKSTDNGGTWTDFGFTLQAPGGVWSPTAVVEGNKIFVYYHGGSAGIPLYRQELALDGITELTPRSLVTTPSAISNLDISIINPMSEGGNLINRNQYVLLANSADLHQILRYTSLDGINFNVDPLDNTAVLIEGGPNYVVTPHVEYLSQGELLEYNVYFGFDSTLQIVNGTPAPLNFDSIQNWTFQQTRPVPEPSSFILLALTAPLLLLIRKRKI